MSVQYSNPQPAPRPARIERPGGKIAYTVMSIPEIEGLPWRHLLALADAVGFVNPVGAYATWPQDFRPLSVI